MAGTIVEIGLTVNQETVGSNPTPPVIIPGSNPGRGAYEII